VELARGHGHAALTGDGPAQGHGLQAVLAVPLPQLPVDAAAPRVDAARGAESEGVELAAAHVHHHVVPEAEHEARHGALPRAQALAQLPSFAPAPAEHLALLCDREAVQAG